MDFTPKEKKFLISIVTKTGEYGQCPFGCDNKCPIFRARDEEFKRFLVGLKEKFGSTAFLREDTDGYNRDSNKWRNMELKSLKPNCDSKSRIIAAKTLIRDCIIGQDDIGNLLLGSYDD